MNGRTLVGAFSITVRYRSLRPGTYRPHQEPSLPQTLESDLRISLAA